MGNSACCSTAVKLTTTYEAEKQDPLAVLEDIVRKPYWNDSDASLAESSLRCLYVEARSFEHHRKAFAHNSTLLTSLHLSCGTYVQYDKLVRLGFQLLDLIAPNLSDGILLQAAKNALKVFHAARDSALRRDAVTILTTFYRIAPKHRPKLRHMLERMHDVETTTVASQTVLKALRCVTVAAHVLPTEWASSFEVLSPGWTEINPLLSRCRALEKNKGEYYVLYKVTVAEGTKELKKYLVVNELLNMRTCEGIVPCGAYVHEDRYLYVMRADMGVPSLAELLEAGEDVDSRGCLHQILHVLAHCSKSDLSHGGIHPNCIYYKAGVWHVADWGVERFSNYLLGKLEKAPVSPDTAHIAPEARLRKKVKDEPATDIWACGVLFMRLLERRQAVIQGAFASEWLDGLLPDQNICLSTEDAGNFASACLQRQPPMRIAASDALEHELFDDIAGAATLTRSMFLRRLSPIIPPSVRPPSAQRTPQRNEFDSVTRWQSAEELKQFLISNNVEVSKLGVGKARSVQNLFWEVSNRESVLEFTDSGRISRRVTVVEIKLYANTAYGRKVLGEVARGTEKKDGKRFIVKKLLAHETWEEASHRSLASELGLSAAFQKNYLQLRGHRVADDEREGYGNYPGLLSRYRIHTVTLQFSSVNEAEVIEANIGLPDGDPFVTKETNILGTEREHFWEWALKSSQMPA